MGSSDHDGGNDDLSLKSLGDGVLRRLLAIRSAKAGAGARPWRNRMLTPSTVPGLALLAALSALCGTGILFVLNSEALLVQNRSYSAALALLFITVLVAYRLTQQRVISRASAAVEQALHGWRTGIAEKVTRLSLRDTEQLSRGRMLDGLARHYEQLSQTIVPLVAGFEALILLCFMLVYLFTLSVLAGLLTVSVAGLLVLGYMNTERSMKGEMRAAGNADARLARLAEEVTDGFKELRLDPDKCVALERDIVEASDLVARHRTRTAGMLSQLITTGNSASYLLAGAVVFILPVLTDSGGSEIQRIITAVLFLLGPIGGVVGAMQQLATGQFCVQAIAEFEREVDALLVLDHETGEATLSFSSIKLVEVHYAHRKEEGEAGFSVAGLNLSLERGEIVFLTGANGSGKTTALRLLTGLYPLDSGRIEIDGRALPASSSQGYRNFFGVVFADNHIFRKPYGLDLAGMERLEKALSLLDIRQKLPDDLSLGYDPDILSTGQRKRLALALAIAQDRPVLVFDEWAADQDPATRARFYNEFLPMLKASGKTVFAVTHDDRYFGCADARYHMEEGRMQRVIA
ncbi:ATP-binding cassette domain-containing protein [Aestuariivirga sp.]|jgi:putative ATP-binding cassette transporter|uniref:ATP-binding cassette domain-containing protein n=1 Tax=Aestuariivirga sp. TaxID=2650926 RepID=UPI003783149B